MTDKKEAKRGSDPSERFMLDPAGIVILKKGDPKKDDKKVCKIGDKNCKSD